MSVLNQSQTQAFTKPLRGREMELRKIVHVSFLDSDNKTYVEVAGRVLDVDEHFLADLLSDLHIIDLEKEVAELADVEVALGRTKAGTCGQCAGCGTESNLNGCASVLPLNVARIVRCGRRG
ncbi:MAG: hypothetical protein ACYDDO_15530 [Acidiferrobacterales bacterium]